MQTLRILRRKKILGFREAVLSAAENSSSVTEKLYR
jgi:hypothetical protein